MNSLNSFIREAVAQVPQVKPLLSSKARYILACAPIEYKTYDYYLNQLNGLVRGVYENNLGGDFITIMANLISGQLTQAYQQAFEEQGFTDFVLPEYLSSSLEAMILGQYDHVDKFFRDIVDARIDETPIAPLLVRAQLWAQRWTEAYNEAVRLITVNSGGNLEWIYAPEKEHCPECESLNGIVMWASEWDLIGVKPQNAPNSALTCGGWKCGCALVPTDKRRSPNAYGRVEEIILSKK